MYAGTSVAGLTRHDPGYIRLAREGRYLAGQKVVTVRWSMSKADREKDHRGVADKGDAPCVG